MAGLKMQVIVDKIIEKIPKNFSLKKWVRISIGLIVFGAYFAFTKPVFLQAIVRHLYIGTPGHYVRSVFSVYRTVNVIERKFADGVIIQVEA